MTNSKTHIRFPTHAVYCEVKGERIYIFKYADHGCDFDVFESTDQLGASDYIVEPLSQIHYRIAFPGEE